MRLRGRRMRSPAGRRLNSPTGGAKPIEPPVAGYLVWADSVFGRFQERTGAAATTAVGVGDPVGTWLARSGQYAVAPSDAARPTAQLAAGAVHLGFDATDDGMRYSPEIDLTGAVTLFLCGRAGTDNTATRRALQSQSINAVISLTDRNDGANWNLAGNNLAAAEAPSGTPRSVGMTIPAAGTALAWSNGVQVGAGAGRADWRELRLGADGLFAEPADAQFRHLLIYPSELTANQMLALHNWGTAA